jgi:hypothetical protein
MFLGEAPYCMPHTRPLSEGSRWRAMRPTPRWNDCDAPHVLGADTEGDMACNTLPYKIAAARRAHPHRGGREARAASHPLGQRVLR